MSARKTRSLLRWTHIGLGLLLATWLYSPLVGNQLATDAVRFLLVPFLAISGLTMWQQMPLSRALDR